MANKKIFFSFNLFLLLLFCSGFVACTTERNPCLEPKVPKLSISCLQYKSEGNNYIDTALPNANFVSLDIDSARFWYWGADALSKFDLVLSPLRDTSLWTLQADSSFSPIDTITFIYERKLKFISNACGYSHDYTLKEVRSTNRNLDSVRIVNHAVTTKAGTENVKIYF
ncbi:MAG: DUF6452 family protein [Bacteroidota bacterium]